MTEGTAADKADEFIKLMLQYQDNLCGWPPLANANNAKNTASHLATLRQELIEQLKKQP